LVGGEFSRFAAGQGLDILDADQPVPNPALPNQVPVATL
jgi:hypothetical protein